MEGARWVSRIAQLSHAGAIKKYGRQASVCRCYICERVRLLYPFEMLRGAGNPVELLARKNF